MEHDPHDMPYQAEAEEDEEEEEGDPAAVYPIRPHGRSKQREITKEKLTTVRGSALACL